MHHSLSLSEVLVPVLRSSLMFRSFFFCSSDLLVVLAQQHFFSSISVFSLVYQLIISCPTSFHESITFSPIKYTPCGYMHMIYLQGVSVNTFIDDLFSLLIAVFHGLALTGQTFKVFYKCINRCCDCYVINKSIDHRRCNGCCFYTIFTQFQHLL